MAELHKAPFQYSSWMLLCLIAFSSLQGCATIRKFNPLESKTVESRRLTQEAEAAIHESNLDRAESKLIVAIERDPTDNHARAVLADVLWKRGAQNAAVEQMARSIDLSGRRDSNQLTQLGQMLLATGDDSSALLRAEEAIAVDPSLADAWTLKGFALKNQGNAEAALSAFFRSLSIRNDDPCTRLEIARIYHQNGQSQRALSILGAPHPEAVQACPNYADVCYLRGLLLRDLDRPADAVIAFRDARDAGHEASDLLFCLADAQLQIGEVLQARATLTDAAAVCGPDQNAALADLQRRVDAKLPAVSVWR